MITDQYLFNILQNIGIAIMPENNSEIIIKFDISYDKKNEKFILSDSYKISDQPFGTIISDFQNANFSNKEDFINFYNKYFLFGLEKKKLLKLFIHNSCSLIEYNTYIDNLFKKYKKALISFQKDINYILEYCLLNPENDTNGLTPFDRLCILEYTPDNPSLLQEKVMQVVNMNIISDINNSNNDKCEIIKNLKNKKISTSTISMYIPETISSLLHYELSEILKDNIILRTCNYCSKYFIADNRHITYCNNIAPGYTNKTCKQIGRYKKFKDNRKDDDAIKLFDKVYNNKAYKASRYKDINDYIVDYKHYQEIGKKKLEKYKNNELSKESFIDWINRNK